MPRPPDHRLPPIYNLLALITFLTLAMTILIQALDEYAKTNTQP